MIITNNINSIDKSRFSYALGIYNSENNGNTPSHGKIIGTLGEKSLHAVLKRYYEPDGSRHEIPVGNYVADIVNQDGIFEIQTRGLSNLRPKLNELLEFCRVTVVHPVIVSRRIISMNSETGEIISVRKSPKHGSVYSALRELYTLREFVTDGRLTIRLPFLTADEYRAFGIKTNRRKKQRTKNGEYVSDTVPTDIIDEIILAQPSDYAVLIPAGLPENFGAADFAAAARTDPAAARMALNLLVRTGLASRTGKNGNSIVYKLV